MPLRALITFAYQLQRVPARRAIPTWIRNENFDIVAKMEGDPPPVMPGTGPDPHMLAMRTLLAERFKLAVHRETREMDIYALVLARPDGKLGPALKPTTQDCAAMMAAARGGPPPGPPPGPNSPVVCGMRGLPGRLVAGAMPMSLLANNLSGQVQRIVVDRTGLSGAWDFEITFAPERPLNPPPGVEFPAGRSQRAVVVHRDAGAARSQAAIDEGSGRSARRRARRATDIGLGNAGIAGIAEFLNTEHTEITERQKHSSGAGLRPAT